MVYNGTLNDYGKAYNYCTIYIVLFVIAFLIIIGISSEFVYNNINIIKIIFVLNLMSILKQQFIRYINGKYQTN